MSNSFSSFDRIKFNGGMRRFDTIDQIKDFNASKRRHYFDDATMRWFSSRANDQLFGDLGNIFITSEIDRPRQSKRRYTVRYINVDSGACDRLSEFQEFASMRAAKKWAARYVQTLDLGSHNEPDGTDFPDLHFLPWDERAENNPPDLIDIFNEAIAAIPYPDVEPTLITMGDLDDDSQEVEYSEEYIFPIGTLANETLWAGGWVELRRDGFAHESAVGLDNISISALFGVSRSKDGPPSDPSAWRDSSTLGVDQALLGYYDLDSKTWTFEIDTY